MKDANGRWLAACMIMVTVALVSTLEVRGVQAGMQGPPFNPPAGPGAVPPCMDPDLLPPQAKVPCVGIVSFAPGTSPAERAQIVRGARATLRFNYQLVDAAAVLVPDEGALSAILSDKRVVEVIPDRPVHALGKPAGGGGVQVIPAGVARIGAAPGALPVTGNGVGVAIVDTGLDLLHQDLHVAASCYSAFSGTCQDNNGHGTHVGGIVAALDNAIDVVGVAPKATLYAVKVLDRTGSGSDATIMAGIDWIAANVDALDPRIRVVNMSLGRPGSLDDNPLLRSSVQTLTGRGVAVVVAAGNDPAKEVSAMVPATYPEVFAVASTTAAGGSSACRTAQNSVAADTASFFTTDGAFDGATGIGVCISAPGEDQENISKACALRSAGILSLKLGGGTTRMSGTSMAAPHVAGVIALLEEANGGAPLDPERARCAIRTGANRIGVAPLAARSAGSTFDGEREGIVAAMGALNATCP
jgi:subtilisin